MKKLTLTVLFTAMICSFVFVCPARATIVWDWEFLNSGLFVPPDVNVIQMARITNFSTAGETVGYTGNVTALIINAAKENEPGYVDTWGTDGTFFNQFIGTVLHPGESKDFVFAIYDPIGNAAIGYHAVEVQTMQLGLVDGSNTRLQGAFHVFEWCTSSNPDECMPPLCDVPEPLSLLLFGPGLLGSLYFRKNKIS